MRSHVTLVFMLLWSLGAFAASSPDSLALLRATPQPDGATEYSVSLQLLLAMGALTLLPSFLLTLTSFTRVIIVLSILRQALGTAQSPPNQILIGLALVITLFVMQPTFEQVEREALTPFQAAEISGQTAVERASRTLKAFMLRNTRNADLLAMLELSGRPPYQQMDDVPFTVAAPAFVLSELRAGFEIGFMLFIPFLIIDLVVASILMSLGMMMVSPMLVSLPFKLLLFVGVDGWALTVGSLVQSYRQ